MPPKSKSDVPKCSGCARLIKKSFEASLHPLLGVLVCRKCYQSYGNGDFSTFEDGVDENGDDNFCRLCVDGGDLYFCGNTESTTNKCHYAFCRDCIERLCPDDQVLHVAPDDQSWGWTCLACDTTKLSEHKKKAQKIMIKLSMKDLSRGASHSDEATGSAIKKRKTQGADTPYVPVIDKSKTSKTDTGSKLSAKNPETANLQEKSKSQKSADTSQRSQATEQARPTKVADTSLQNPGRAKHPDNDAGSSRRLERASMPFTDKPKTSKADTSLQRDPEATSLPPLVEKPRQPQTSLRTLGFKTSTPLTKQPSAPVTILVKASTSTPLPTSKTAQAPTDQSKSTTAPSAPAKPITVPTKPTSLPTKPTSLPAKPTTVSSNPTTATSQPNKAPSVIIIGQSPSKGGTIEGQRQPTGQAQSSLQPLRARPTSKQLRVNNETVVPKIVLNETDLKKRLEHFRSVKDHCLKEIDSKFSTILEMFDPLEVENKSLLKCEISDFNRIIQEFQNMVSNLDNLSQAQT